MLYYEILAGHPEMRTALIFKEQKIFLYYYTLLNIKMSRVNIDFTKIIFLYQEKLKNELESNNFSFLLLFSTNTI